LDSTHIHEINVMEDTVAAAANNISRPSIFNHPYCLTLSIDVISSSVLSFPTHTHTRTHTCLSDLFGCTFPQSQTFLCCQGKTASLRKTKVLLKWHYHFTEENSIWLQL